MSDLNVTSSKESRRNFEQIAKILDNLANSQEKLLRRIESLEAINDEQGREI